MQNKFFHISLNEKHSAYFPFDRLLSVQALSAGFEVLILFEEFEVKVKAAEGTARKVAQAILDDLVLPSADRTGGTSLLKGNGRLRLTHSMQNDNAKLLRRRNS